MPSIVNTTTVDKKTEIRAYWKRDGMEIRTLVLHLALIIESKVRWCVEFLLTENKEIASLINWDFNKRIQFLTTLEALTEDEKGKFTVFQNIRNTMLHDLAAKTLVDCYRIMGKDPNDHILNRYPRNRSLPLEEQIHKAIQLLIDDIGDLLAKVEKHVIDRVPKDAKAAHFFDGYTETITAVAEAAGEVSEEISKQLKGGEQLTASTVAWVAVAVMKRSNELAQKRTAAKAKDVYKVDLDEAEKNMNEKRAPR